MLIIILGVWNFFPRKIKKLKKNVLLMFSCQLFSYYYALSSEAHDPVAFYSGSELGFLSSKISFFECNIGHAFSRVCRFKLLSTFGHNIGVLKSPALFQGKELQVTRFKVTCFKLITGSGRSARNILWYIL